MPSPTSRPPLAAPAEFADGLGVRSIIAEKHGEALELFRIRPEFSRDPDFELALRERVSRLANFRQAYYARVRRIEREGGVLGVVSEHAAGARLSHVLDVSERHGLDLDINAALCLMRQLVPAVATLHQNARDVSHGALAPERILVTAYARIVITDYVLGSAIEQLRLPRERLWRDLQIAVPPGAGDPQLDHRADVMQIGLVALALIRGRRLREDELRAAGDLVVSATENVLGKREPISAPLRRWLMRALQLDPRAPFESAADAQAGLEEVLASEGGYIAAPVALETFLSRYQECALLDDEAAEEADVDETADEQDAPTERASAMEPAPRPADPSIATTRPSTPKPSTAAKPPSPAKPNSPVKPPSPANPLPIVSEAVPVQESSAATTHDHVQSSLAADPGTAIDDANRPLPVAKTRDLGPARDGGPSHPHGDDVAPASRSGIAFVSMPADSRDRGQEPAAMPDDAGTGGMSRVQRWALVAAIAIAVLEGAFIGYMQWFSPSALLAGKQGTLSIESRPTAVPVVIDGEARGATPLSVSLPAGPHVMELAAAGGTRVIPITIDAGMRHAQYIELPSHGMTGALQVRGPSGLRVLVDGDLRGKTPLTISDLAPGEHDILFDGPHGQTRTKVTIQAGVTASISPGSEATLVGTGWAAIEVPYEMQVFEEGRLLGTTAGNRLTLTTGRHVLEIVSDTLGFRTTKVVTITAGQATRVAVPLPTGRVTITSDPAAEVWLEGQKIGDTPLENFPLPIGPHEVVVRHPALGEQHQVVSVNTSTPARLAVTFKP